MSQVRYIAAILLQLLCNAADAQTGTVSITVKDNTAALEAATVSLLKSSGSAWVRSELTDRNGMTQMDGIAPGNYLVVVTSVGYRQSMAAVAVKAGERSACEVGLQKDSTTLGEVAVTGKRPFIEMSLGKTIVNIEGAAVTGALTALDLMRRLPGVTVDVNGGITMRGKDGVLVLIDDRPTYLAGDDLAAYLKTITADETAQIELITQPGAKYDAAGNTGVINIKLRKNKKRGLNGTASASYGNAVYFHRDESLLLNYRKNRLNLTASINDMEAMGFADWHEQLYITDVQTGEVMAKSVIRSNPVERFSNTALRIGADYAVSDNTKLGASARGTYHPNTMPSTLFSTDSNMTGNGVTHRDVWSKDFSVKRDVMANAYLTRKLGKAHTLDINTDYLLFSKLANQEYRLSLLDDAMHQVANAYQSSSRQPLRIEVFSLKADHTGTAGKDIKIESGIKVSVVNTDLDASFRQNTNGAWTDDTGRTNHFIYRERIYAAYAGVSRTFGKKWEAKVALRVEQTDAEGVQLVGNARFTRSYFSPFPTAFVSYKADSNNRFEVNYGRRIDRPQYRQLNPFANYSFQNTYQQGNPYLLPQYTDNIEIKHGYKNVLITTLTLSRTTDVIADQLEVRGADRTVYNVERNVTSNSYASLDVNFNKDVTTWMSLNVFTSVFSAEYRGVVNGKDRVVLWDGYSGSIGIQVNFGHGWRGEGYVNYQSRGRFSLTSAVEAAVYSECAVQKKVNDRLTMRLFAADPFAVFRLRVHDAADNFREDVTNRNATQLFSVSATYTFGKNGEGRNAERSPDEARRL